MKAIIKQFKAVPIRKKGKKEPNNKILEKTIPYGFILSPEVIFNYPETELDDLLDLIMEEFGLNGKQMNSSFHKSWNKVATASMIQLVMEQILHYITTYGFEQLGIYNKDSVYIPNEVLEIPDLNIEGFRFIIIKGYTKEELKTKVFDLLSSGIALKEKTIDDIIDISLYLGINERDIELIKNREVKTILYDYLNLFPENPIDFLQYCIYRSTGQTLLIKNSSTFEKIRNCNNIPIASLFLRYKRKYGFVPLARIFLRFKPIFLAFRTNIKMKKYTNKIRKLANLVHKPMKQDYINDVTSLIKKDKLDLLILQNELKKVNIFRKIRLAYALKYRTKDNDSILYRIRNGKGYAKEFSFSQNKIIEKALNLVLDSIIEDIKKNVEGKKVYIPETIIYTLPTTEKQFTGNIPSGSFVSIPKDMIIGIHWENVDNNRIDLDLSLLNLNSVKIGWDASYRSGDNTILFSGDVTDAPKPRGGASELFYVQKQQKNEFIMYVNYFNYDKEITVPIKILVASESHTSLTNNYMVDQNKIITTVKENINEKQNILGFLITTENECRFYFVKTSIGNSITSTDNHYTKHSLKYLTNFYKNTINLNEILQKAGALLSNKEECDIDLSPESLEKDSIINLLK
ncbi:MAG: hypothetical protein ACFFA4_16835 [Promethearchaeota archaeon]